MSNAYNLEAVFRDDAVESGKYLSLPPNTQYPAWVADVLSATSAEDLREAIAEVFSDDLAPATSLYVTSFKVRPAVLGAILTPEDWGKVVDIAVQESLFLQNLANFRHELEAKYPPKAVASVLNVREFVRDGGIPSEVRLMMLKMAYARLADTVICHLANSGETSVLIPELLAIIEEGTRVKNEIFKVLKDPPLEFRRKREEWLKNSLATAISGEIAS